MEPLKARCWRLDFLSAGASISSMSILAACIATPVSGLFILLMLWRKDTTGGLRPPTALRICLTICYVVCLFLTFSSFKQLIS